MLLLCDAPHQRDSAYLRREPPSLIELLHIRRAIQLEVSYGGEIWMREDPIHHLGSESALAETGGHDQVENECLVDTIGQHSREPDKSRVGRYQSEDQG